jgi:hypothetical protein
MLRRTRTLDPRRPTADADAPPPRLGRYRLMFEGDPTLRPPVAPDWWLGPLGQCIPFGGHPTFDDVAHRRRIGDTT